MASLVKDGTRWQSILSVELQGLTLLLVPLLAPLLQYYTWQLRRQRLNACALTVCLVIGAASSFTPSPPNPFVCFCKREI